MTPGALTGEWDMFRGPQTPGKDAIPTCFAPPDHTTPGGARIW